MKIQKTMLIIGLICFAFVSNLFAQDALVKSITGKVEYSIDGVEWDDVKVNMKLAKGTMISTSFKSTAVIAINDSLLHVKPLSRMSLEELSKTQDEVQTDLYLVSGKVQVEVKPRAKQEIVNFTVKSAVATASVRGTGFIFDGANLLVNHGEVSLQSNNGFARSVRGGEFSKTTRRGKVSAPVYVAKTTDPVFSVDSASDDFSDEDFDVGITDAVLTSFDELVSDVEREGLFKSEAAKPDPSRINRGRESNPEPRRLQQTVVGFILE